MACSSSLLARTNASCSLSGVRYLFVFVVDSRPQNSRPQSCRLALAPRAKRLVVTSNASEMSRNASTATATTPPVQCNFVVSSHSNAPPSPSPTAGIAWLESMPRGAYTTARTTSRGRCLFELSFHLQRLVDSAGLMHLGRVGGTDHDQEALKQRVLDTMRRGVEAYMRHHGGYDGGYDDVPEDDDHEMKITVLVCEGDAINAENSETFNSNESTFNNETKEREAILVHVSPLGPRKAPGPVRVEIRGEPRANAAAKDSEWVTARKQLAKPDDVNELVLEADGALYEGLSSNFFALMDGTLYTAGDNVLLGSVRESVLRQCEELNVPVVLEPPRLCDAPRWEAAFVSSTSRMLLPVDELLFVSESGADRRDFGYAHDSLARRLEAAVKEDILSSSECIFG